MQLKTEFAVYTHENQMTTGTKRPDRFRISATSLPPQTNRE